MYDVIIDHNEFIEARVQTMAEVVEVIKNSACHFAAIYNISNTDHLMVKIENGQIDTYHLKLQNKTYNKQISREFSAAWF